MDKDLITVKLKDGTTKDMEVILTFQDDKTNINYILYKELDNAKECYAGKYIKNGETFNIDTNLSEIELKILECILAKTLEVNDNVN